MAWDNALGGSLVRVVARRLHSMRPADEADVDVTDDGDSGLFAACSARFPSPDYEVRCDARHTVWVKVAGGSRSVGLPPWGLQRHSLEEMLEQTEEKLGLSAMGTRR